MPRNVASHPNSKCMLWRPLSNPPPPHTHKLFQILKMWIRRHFAEEKFSVLDANA